MSYKEDLKKGKIERGNLTQNKLFLKEIKHIKKSQKILEVGCGAGSMTAHLHQQGFNIIGTDLSKDLLEYAQKTHPKTKFVLMNGESLDFEDESFDIVMSFDVIEHIPDTKQHFKEVHRVLKKGGKYIFVTPNKIVNLPYCIVKDKSLTKWKNYHMSLQTKRSICREFSKAGFRCEILIVNSYNKYIDSKLPPPLNIIAKTVGVAIHGVATKK